MHRATMPTLSVPTNERKPPFDKSHRLTMPIDQLKCVIEAALLASSEPMTANQLGDLFTEEEGVDREQLGRALEALINDCDGRGVELKEVASGFRYQVRQNVHPWISRMWTERPSRYSRALMETLALIAYRQPITRPEIEQIRGVVVSSNIIKTMEEREWIRVVGHRDVPGRPALFGTTRAFLDYFNLKSLDQLPPLSEIRDMEDPQLQLDQTPLPVRIVRDLPIDPDAEMADRRAEAGEESLSANDLQSTDNDLDDSARAAIDDDLSDLPVEADLATTSPATADEAANPADVDHDAAKQNT